MTRKMQVELRFCCLAELADPVLYWAVRQTFTDKPFTLTHNPPPRGGRHCNKKDHSDSAEPRSRGGDVGGFVRLGECVGGGRQGEGARLCVEAATLAREQPQLNHRKAAFAQISNL